MKHVFILAALLAFSCQSNTPTQVLSAEQFAQQIKETPNAIVVDVRTEAELSNGIIENSINIVYDPEFANKLSDLPSQPIFIYCASGKRSAKAAQILRDKGYSPVYELEGGFNNWTEKNMPIESVPASSEE